MKTELIMKTEKKVETKKKKKGGLVGEVLSIAISLTVLILTLNKAGGKLKGNNQG